MSLWTDLFLDLLYKGAGKAVHHAALQILLAPITEDLIAIQHGPVLLEAISLGLEIALALKEDTFLAITVSRSEALVNLTLFILKVR